MHVQASQVLVSGIGSSFQSKNYILLTNDDTNQFIILHLDWINLE